MAGAGLRPINWSKVNLQPTMKNFYAPDKETEQRSQSEIEDWLEKNECTLNGKDIPPPILNFDDAGFPGMLCSGLKQRYF